MKVLKVHNGLLVYDYQNNKLFLFIDATVKIDSEFKIQHVSVKIDKIQIFDEVKMISLNLFELKNHIFSLFLKFKNFMNVIKLLNKSLSATIRKFTYVCITYLLIFIFVYLWLFV